MEYSRILKTPRQEENYDKSSTNMIKLTLYMNTTQSTLEYYVLWMEIFRFRYTESFLSF